MFATLKLNAMSAAPSNSVVQQFIIQAEMFSPSPELGLHNFKENGEKLFWLVVNYKSKEEGAFIEYFKKHL